MPIFENMVCDSLNGAIHGYLQDTSHKDDTNLEEKLHASAKRWLSNPPEYEEAPNYKSPNEALKAKYMVLKPVPPTSQQQQNGINGEEKHNGKAASNQQSEYSVSGYVEMVIIVMLVCRKLI